MSRPATSARLVSDNSRASSRSAPPRPYSEFHCREIFRNLEQQYPEWFHKLDQAEGEYASVEDLQSLLESAPCETLAMMIFMALSVRRQTLALTQALA